MSEWTATQQSARNCVDKGDENGTNVDVLGEAAVDIFPSKDWSTSTEAGNRYLAKREKTILDTD